MINRKMVRLLLALFLLVNSLGLGASKAVFATGGAGAPLAPGELKAVAVSGTEIKLTWQDRSDNETGFTIERSATADGDFKVVHNVAFNVQEVSDTKDLFAETAYWYRVKACNAAGESDYSNVVQATTLPSPPAAPTKLNAAVATISQINLDWIANSTNEKGFKIERKTTTSDFQEVAIVVGAGNTIYADTGLGSGVTYTYRVKAYNDGGDSNYSNIASATTGGIPPVPASLQATVVSSSKSQIKLTWADTSGNAAAFKIERRSGGGSFVEVATVKAGSKEYLDTGLAVSTVYTYRVRAFNDAGNSPYSNEASAVIEVAPAAPSQLSGAVVSSGQIQLTWQDDASNETGFKIERKNGGSNYSQVAIVSQNTTTYTDYGLSTSQTYHYRVRAYNAAGDSAYSPVASISITVPAAPTNPEATILSSTTVGLTWRDNATNEMGFRIERRTGSGSYVQIATVGANATAYTDYGLASSYTYYYRVRAYNAVGHSAYSPEISATTNFLGAPSKLVAETVSRSQINLSWTDNASDESGFKIERRLTGGNYVQIATVGGNVTTYANTGLANNTTYYYRVRAYHAAANSAYSNEASATTGAVPAAPSQLTATPLTSSQVKLVWKDNSADETGFRIERKTGSGSYVQIATVAANNTNYTDTGLSTNVTYYYRVRAYNAAGNSPPSGEAIFFAGVPAAPTKLTATVASRDKIMLTWTDNAPTESGFKIERRTASGSYAQIATVGANIKTYADTDLAGGTVYYYRVRAYNPAGHSAYSNEAKATTTSLEKTVITMNVGKKAYYVNSQLREMDAAPMLTENRTLLPIRNVVEPLGALLKWEQGKKKVTVTFEGKVIELFIDSSTALVDGKAKPIDPANSSVKPIIVPPGRTMLPLRFVVENMGCLIDWSARTQEIKVTYPVL